MEKKAEKKEERNREQMGQIENKQKNTKLKLNRINNDKI